MKQIIKGELRIDPAGDGRYLAQRNGGSRLHKGIDYVCVPSAPVLSDIEGKVTKLGYPYGDDLQWRYVEVSNADGERWRYFYVTPGVQVGDQVRRFEPIGLAQDISERYPGSDMLPHVHFEILDAQGEHCNPEERLGELEA